MTGPARRLRPVTVVTCAGGAAWEVPLIDGLQRYRLGVLVLRRCVDHGELLGVALAERPDAVLVAAELPWLDRELVATLGEQGVAVVAVENGGPPRPLDAIGVTRRVRAGDPPEAVAAVLCDLEPEPPGPAPPQPAGPGGAGRIVAVWGTPGAPGRTTVAVHLAVAAARSGIRTLLIDADVWAPSIAQLLGLAEHPSIARAARLAAAGWEAPLRTCLQPGGPALDVLAGLPRTELWIEVRARSWRAVLDAARHEAQLVVCDLAAPIEEDEELVVDRVPYRRNAVTLATLAAADQVLEVVRGDPIGVRRGVLAHQALRAALPEVADRVELVVNHLPRGGRHRQEASALLSDWTGRAPVAFLGREDAFERVVWEGRPLPEVARRSRWSTELAALRVQVGPAAR